MKKKIYITNFWYAINYGASLTAYAIYKIMNNMCDTTYILNNLQVKDKAFYKKFYVKKFADKYFKLKKIDDIDAPSILMTGSDQVFNPICEPLYNNSKFLKFAKLCDKKIAISASFGVNKETFIEQNSTELINDMQLSLKSFDFISVREKSGLEICKDVLNVNAEWIIDPVFMLERGEWEQLIANSDYCIKKQMKDKKIVSYFLDASKEHTKALKYISKKYDKNFLDLSSFKNSPENWLYAIKNCELFVTNSYHGVCFAIIFNKPFICLSKDTGKSTRFESLFDILNIKNQSVNLNTIYEEDCVFKVDYTNVNQRISEERNKALSFLTRAIDSPIINSQDKINVRINYLENRLEELKKNNNLLAQLKIYLWNKFLLIYYSYLPRGLSNRIWQTVKRLIK